MAAALLLVDVINAFDFADSEPLVRAAEEASRPLAKLGDRARRAEVPVIYVNDNFGVWQSDFRTLVEECSKHEKPGHRVTRTLAPKPGDLFVLKPRHSGFLGTPLHLLLDHLDVGVTIVAGFATNLCVLATVLDAHSRGFQSVVAGDCCAANSPGIHDDALDLMRSLGASVTPSLNIDLPALMTIGKSKLALGT